MRRFSALATGAAVGLGSAFVATAPVGATPPGDGSGVIAFNGLMPGSGVLWRAQTVHPDGSGDQAIPTHSGPGAVTGGEYDYSPDGTALIENLGDGNGVQIGRSDGLDMHSFAAPYAPNVAAWTPDGKNVDYAVNLQDAHSVYESRPNGTGEHLLFEEQHGHISRLAIAANGDIVYSYQPVNPSPGATVGPETVKVWHRATGTTTVISTTGTSPDISPDGTKLVYSLQQATPSVNATVTDLVTCGMDGGNTQPLGVGPAGSSRWSPDGTRIAYVSYNGANSQLQILDLGAKTKTTLATGVGDGIGWQPRAVALPPPAPPTVDRIGGGDRVATAVAASRFEFDDATSNAVYARKASVAVLSRMDTFADALSGSALAGAKNGPLLLTPSSNLDRSVLAELHRVLPSGATVYLLGGIGALSTNVEATLRAEGFVPKRLAGNERYETSLDIAREISPSPRAVYVASGENYPDALAAGAVAAARQDAVVLLAPAPGHGYLSAAAQDYIHNAVSQGGPQMNLYGVGGPGFQALELAFTNSTQFTAVFGQNRYETAAAVAHTRPYPWSGHIVALATGNNWADALSGGVVAGLNAAPLLLADTTSVPGIETGKLDGAAHDLPAEVIVFGQTGAVSQAAVNSLTAASGVTGWNDSLNRQAPPIP